MAKSLHILIVEDSASDAGLIARHIEHAGYAMRWERVDDPATLKVALDQQPWDMILCDYSMVDFSGTDALAIVRASGLDIPFIFVSGAMGEDVAVEAMKAGAHDYMMKGNLKRLVPAIERELRDAAERRKRKQAEQMLRQSEQRFRALIEHCHDAIALFGANGVVLYASPSTTKVLGYLPEELLERNALDFVRPDWQDAVRERLAESLRQPGVRIPAEAYVRHKDGEYHFLECIFTNLLHEPAVGAIVNNYRDITGRKQAEETFQQRAAELERFHRISVGRELRMIELKKEVNELAKLAGRTPPYDLSRLEIKP